MQGPSKPSKTPTGKARLNARYCEPTATSLGVQTFVLRARLN